jgi:hypothetical protein
MEALQKWAFDTGSLNLINTPETLRIVVLRSDDDEELLNDFIDAVKTNDWGAVDELQSQLQELMVTVSIYNPESEEQRVKKEVPEVLPDTLDGLYRVDARTDESGTEGSKWYDEETGFTIPGSTVDSRII